MRQDTGERNKADPDFDDFLLHVPVDLDGGVYELEVVKSAHLVGWVLLYSNGGSVRLFGFDEAPVGVVLLE